MNPLRRFWSAADVAAMIRMREIENQKWTAIDRILKRPVGGSAAKYESLRRDKSPRHPKEAGGRVEVSHQLEADRSARKLAENTKSVTASFFGDPPPGYSALDRKRQGAGW